MMLRIKDKGNINGGFSWEWRFADSSVIFKHDGATVARFILDKAGATAELNLIPERYRSEYDRVCFDCACIAEETLTAYEWQLLTVIRRELSKINRRKNKPTKEAIIDALIEQVTGIIKNSLNECSEAEFENYKHSPELRRITARILEKKLTGAI